MTEPQPVMDQAELDQLTRQVGRALLAIAGEGWRQVRAEYRSVGRHIEVDVFVTGPDGTPRPVRPPLEVVEGLGKLRQGMYRPGRGTWLSALYVLEPPSSFTAEFEPDVEPRWRRLPPPIGFVDELRFFPRTDEHIPDWLRQRAAGRAPGETPGQPDGPDQPRGGHPGTPGPPAPGRSGAGDPGGHQPGAPGGPGPDHPTPEQSGGERPGGPGRPGNPGQPGSPWQSGSPWQHGNPGDPGDPGQPSAAQPDMPGGTTHPGHAIPPQQGPSGPWPQPGLPPSGMPPHRQPGMPPNGDSMSFRQPGSVGYLTQPAW